MSESFLSVDLDLKAIAVSRFEAQKFIFVQPKMFNLKFSRTRQNSGWSMVIFLSVLGYLHLSVISVPWCHRPSIFRNSIRHYSFGQSYT